MSDAIIRVEQLSKTFGTIDAVKDVSFDVSRGEIFAFLGPNGAGKTTTIKMMTTLLRPTGGRILIDGLDPVTHPHEVRSRFGIVFQDPDSQIVMERVEDDVAFGLENRGWLRGRMLGRVPEALRAVGLDGLERRRGNRLSCRR